MEYCEQARRERGGASQGERKRRRERRRGVEGRLQNISLLARAQAGGGGGNVQEQGTQVLSWPQRRRQGRFAHSPLALQVFHGTKEQHYLQALFLVLQPLDVPKLCKEVGKISVAFLTLISGSTSFYFAL
jgi:hypothetical protein